MANAAERARAERPNDLPFFQCMWTKTGKKGNTIEDYELRIENFSSTFSVHGSMAWPDH
jgi:hypothetical protein